MQAKRLLKLADLLEADAKNRKGVKFDLGEWGEVSSDATKEEVAMSCGTKACAMGLACISGEFKGLSFELSLTSDDYGQQYNLIVPTYTDKNGDREEGWHVAETYFGLDWDESRYLFSEDYYEGPTEGAAAERVVAKRIRQFVKSSGRMDFAA